MDRGDLEYCKSGLRGMEACRGDDLREKEYEIGDNCSVDKDSDGICLKGLLYCPQTGEWG